MSDMTDKELIELAAKAAGFNLRWFKVKQWKNMNGRIGPYRYFTGTVDVYGSHHTKPWNPLTDDGDALRLAVKLDMHIALFCVAMDSRVLADGDDWVVEGWECGKYEATRRAITRAAAQIGREME